MLPKWIRLPLFLFSHRNARHDKLIITVMMKRGGVRFKDKIKESEGR